MLNRGLMKVQTVSEGIFDSSKTAVEWLPTLKGIPLFGDKRGFATPKDSGEKTALARLLIAIFASLPGSQIVLYVSEWGIWPSSENMELFDSYRLAKGETRKLEEAPVHSFESADDPALMGTLCLALYFIWGVEIFDSERKCSVSLSHDEWVEIRTSDPSALEVCNHAASNGAL
jgi:hypothetical protein